MTRRRGELERHRGRMPATGDARRTWSERDGILLRLVEDDGVEGFGEASPLPGYSPDTVAEAEKELRAFLDGALDLQALRSPSARAALETARFDLEARRRDVPLEAILAERVEAEPAAELPLAGLVPFGGSDEAAVERAGALVGEGYGTLKVKVGGDDDDRLDLLREIRRRWDVRLRLDANQTWPRGEVARRLAAYASLDPPPEFIEEPARFASPREAKSAMADSTVPLALDETLQSLGNDALDAWLGAEGAKDAVQVVVLKPTVLGVERALEIGRRARRRGVGVVLSHAFDGPVAREMAACLARVLADGSCAQGLAPHAALDAWPPWTSPRLRGAQIEAADVTGLGPVRQLWDALA